MFVDENETARICQRFNTANGWNTPKSRKQHCIRKWDLLLLLTAPFSPISSTVTLSLSIFDVRAFVIHLMCRVRN